MSAEAEVQGALRRLRVSIPLLTGALAATVDGLVLAEDTVTLSEAGPSGSEPLAALTAAALSVAFRMTEATARGDFRELLIHGEQGYIAVYAAGPSAVLTVLADERVNVGRLHLEGRRCAALIGACTEQALRTRGARPKAPDQEPAAPRPQPLGGSGVRLPLERRRRNPPGS